MVFICQRTALLRISTVPGVSELDCSGGSLGHLWLSLLIDDNYVEGQIRKNDRMYFSVEVLQIHLFLNLTGFQLAISFINSGRKPTDLKVTFSRIIIWLGKQSFPFRYIWCTAVVSSSYCVSTSSPWC